MLMSDGSSDVCSSDLLGFVAEAELRPPWGTPLAPARPLGVWGARNAPHDTTGGWLRRRPAGSNSAAEGRTNSSWRQLCFRYETLTRRRTSVVGSDSWGAPTRTTRSEEHTSETQ